MKQRDQQLSTIDVVVKKGDTLGQLAKSKGTTVDKVVKFNPGLNPDKIRVGQTLKFPA